ncbi:hypothetical protein YC2023_011671 [Brassica napus]
MNCGHEVRSYTCIRFAQVIFQERRKKHKAILLSEVRSQKHQASIPTIEKKVGKNAAREHENTATPNYFFFGNKRFQIWDYPTVPFVIIKQEPTQEITKFHNKRRYENKSEITETN